MIVYALCEYNIGDIFAFDYIWQFPHVFSISFAVESPDLFTSLREQSNLYQSEFCIELCLMLRKLFYNFLSLLFQR